MNFTRYLSIRFVLIYLFILFTSQSLYANSTVTLETFFVSELSLRGLTEAPDKPAIGFNLEWSAKENMYIGSTVIVARSLPVQQREKSIAIYAGIQQQLSDDIALGLSASYREFPGSTKEWDYSELNFALGIADVVDIELAYSPNYYEHDTNAWFLSARSIRSISRDFFAGLEIGAGTFSREVFDNYQYAEFGIGYRKKRFVSELSLLKASNDGESIFGTIAQESGLRLKLSYLLK